MKKLLFTFMCVGLLSINSKAQNIIYGATGGINIANVSGSYFDDFDARLGVNIQGFADFMVSKKFSIQPGIGFTMQGGVGKEKNDLGDIYKADMALNYVNVPITLKYYLIKGLALELGPQFGFLVDGKIKTEINSNDQKPTVTGTENARDYLETMDVSLNAGASYVFAKKYILIARYNAGLSDLNSSVENLVRHFESGVNNGFDFRNTGFSFSVGYRF
jgi:hypothetical protein